jgi:hypothetical protein
MIRGERHLIAMPMLARLRDEIGEPVQDLKRRELQDDARARLRELSLPPGPTELAAL